MRCFANQRRPEFRWSRDFIEENQRLRAGRGYLSAVAMHILQQAPALKVVAEQLRDIHYDAPRGVVAHSFGPRKQNILYYAPSQTAGNFNAEFSAVVANVYAHQAVTDQLD